MGHRTVLARRLLGLAAVAALGGCGAEEEPAGGRPAPATAVRIVADADGGGPRPARSARLVCPSPTHEAACARLRALEPWVLEPVPDRKVCTLIYGGPGTARIAGVRAGRRIAARFSQRNGCEIRRYERIEPLLALTG